MATLRNPPRHMPCLLVTMVLISASPLSAVRPMPIGINFLPPGWGGWDLQKGNYANIFNGEWRNVTGQEPVFKPMVVQDLAIFNGPFRPMEMNAVNRCMQNPYHASGRWADRKPASDLEQYEPVAYEYQILLCNTVGRDYWVNVPCTADDDYFTQLATLIKGRLNGNLRCYVEWGNEVWNSAGSAFQSYIYAQQKVTELSIPGTGFTPLARYIVLRSCQMFAAFDAVFADQPGRLYKVMPGWQGHDLTERQFEAAADPVYNPDGVQFNGYAIPAYVGGSLNGSSPGIFDEWTASIPGAIAGEDGWQHMRDLCDANGVELISYECGTHVTSGVPNDTSAYTLDPRMYGMFYNYYDIASDYFDLMLHFAYCGTYQMHCKLWAEQPTADAHTYRAIRDWLVAHPVGVADRPVVANQRAGARPVRSIMIAHGNRTSHIPFPWSRCSLFDLHGRYLGGQSLAAAPTSGRYVVQAVSGGTSVEAPFSVVR